MLAIATVDPRESRGSNPRRRATTEHPEHTEDRKPEDGQPRNTQNKRKTENRKRNNHGTHRTRGSQEITEEQRTGEREVWIGGRRCSVEELQRQRAGRMARGQIVWDEKQKTPTRNPRGGFKNPAIPTFALVCTIIGSESLTTVFGMGTGDPF